MILQIATRMSISFSKKQKKKKRNKPKQNKTKKEGEMKGGKIDRTHHISAHKKDESALARFPFKGAFYCDVSTRTSSRITCTLFRELR